MNQIELILVIITIWITLFTFWRSAYQYFDVRKREQDLKEFENYHKLIKELVMPDENTQATRIDRQTAIIYELKFFPRYYEFSNRTLKWLKEKWNYDNQFPRLIEEINLTIEFLNRKIN